VKLRMSGGPRALHCCSVYEQRSELVYLFQSSWIQPGTWAQYWATRDVSTNENSGYCWERSGGN